MSEVAKRNNRNKRAGSAWESRIEADVRGSGFEIERLRQSGQRDQGDHAIRINSQFWCVVEAKSGAVKLTDFVRQAEAEAAYYAEKRGLDINVDVTPVVYVKQRGKASALDGFAIMRVSDHLELLELAGLGRLNL